MASMFLSLFDTTITKLPTLHQLFSPSPAASSSSSGYYSQMVDGLETLRRRMKRIRALLTDAEEREIREISIKHWLDELKDVAYDAEDVVEEFEYEVLRYKLASEEEQNDSIRDQERQIVESRCEVSDLDVPPPCAPPHDAAFQEQILDKIKKINRQFDEIYGDAHKLGLHEEAWRRRGDFDVFKPPRRFLSSSLINEQEVRGRDDDKHELIKMLLSGSAATAADGSCYGESVRVVSIVGMGGIGKTTLAQLVYNDNLVREHFETRVWVCVSEPFDVIKLTKEILQAVGEQRGPGESEAINFDCLQHTVSTKLRGKRFLLVLDDVWNKNQERWGELWVSLSSGAQGSRVLITTRDEQVSRICRASEPNMYRLGCLSPEDSWSLFEKRAFGGGRRSSDHPNLVTIGRQIVRKCDGLPLALKTLSGLLFDDLTEDTWKDVSRSELWELPEDRDHILPALKLSYHHLPSPIKRCYAYCAVFPKDHVFHRDDLVFMWMAQGYLQPTAGRCMEDVGRAYLEELLQRSFFQRDEKFGQIVMHDMIHDLAVSIWGTGECCKAADGKLASGKARHLLLESEENIKGCLSVEATNLKRVRTVFTSWFSGHDTIPKATVKNCVMWVCADMKYLRVLDLCLVGIDELPDSVGNLQHLRYLAISGCDHLRRLPESLGNLLNLQVLRLRCCSAIEELPRRLALLTNLRHLDVGSANLGMMPRGIGRLTQLQTLPLFVVGAEESGTAAGIEELSRLNDLRGKLEIEVRGPNNNVQQHVGILRNKEGLNTLQLDFGSQWNLSPPSRGEEQQQHQHEQLIENLQPHTNIKFLTVWRYFGGRLPRWLGDASYQRLEEIDVCNCGDCRHWSTLGQLPSLKRLYVVDALSAEELFDDGTVVHEATFFPSLEVLYLKRLHNCEGISVGTEKGGAFPHLEELKIRVCPKLEYVKLRHLTALKRFHILKCDALTTLDVETPAISPRQSSWSSELQHPPQGVPNVHTMSLYKCPKLTFLPFQRHQQQPIFPSLRKLDVVECPSLSKWVEYHLDKFLSLSWLRWEGRLIALQNVVDVDEASMYEVGTYNHFQKMELRWDLEHQKIFSRPGEAEELLDRLCPAFRLDELVIQGYLGRSFPNWVAHHGYLDNLVKMTLFGCAHCERLPPLSLLPALRQLLISNMGEVRHVGSEFYGGWCGGFPSLQILEFHDMPKWEEWQAVEEDVDVFPNLQLLRIYN